MGGVWGFGLLGVVHGEGQKIKMAAGASIFILFRWFQRRSVGAGLVVAPRVENLLEVVRTPSGCHPVLGRSSRAMRAAPIFKYLQ